MKYNQALQEALTLFAAREPAQIEENSGACYLEDQQAFQLLYFNQKHFISYPTGTVKIQEGAEIDQSDHLMIIQYLNSQAPITPTNKWVSFLELPGGPNHYPPF